MKLRSPLFAAVAALTLAGGLTACSPAEQETTEAELEEEAAQVGGAIEAGAREVAQEVDQATDDLAEAAQDQRHETAADDESAAADPAAP